MWEIMFKEKYTYAKEDLFWYIYAIVFGAWNLGIMIGGIVDGKPASIIIGFVVFLFTLAISYAMIRVYNSQRMIRHEIESAIKQWEDAVKEFNDLKKVKK